MNSPRLPPAQFKYRNVYIVLMAGVVIAGFIWQLKWMQQVRRTGAENIAPNSFMNQLGNWMLETRGGAAAGGANLAAGVETLECNNCLGTGSVLSETGARAICPICLGVGSRLIRRQDDLDRICPLCAGMGRTTLPDTDEVGTCPRCGGRGLVRPAEPAP